MNKKDEIFDEAWLLYKKKLPFEMEDTTKEKIHAIAKHFHDLGCTQSLIRKHEFVEILSIIKKIEKECEEQDCSEELTTLVQFRKKTRKAYERLFLFAQMQAYRKLLDSIEYDDTITLNDIEKILEHEIKDIKRKLKKRGEYVLDDQKGIDKDDNSS